VARLLFVPEGRRGPACQCVQSCAGGKRNGRQHQRPRPDDVRKRVSDEGEVMSFILGRAARGKNAGISATSRRRGEKRRYNRRPASMKGGGKKRKKEVG